MISEDLTPQSRLLTQLAEQRVRHRELIETLESKLQAAQNYIRSLLESNNDALTIIDPRGCIVEANRQMERLTGCTRETLLGSAFKSHFTDPVRVEAGIRSALYEDQVTTGELTARATDGRETVVSYNATTFNRQDRDQHGVFVAAHDVTERKRVESRFHGLLESAPEAMMIVNQEGRIVLINSQTEKLFGYDRHELLGQLVEMALPEHQTVNHPASCLAYFQHRRAPTVGRFHELFGTRKNGEEFPVEVSFSPLETEEGILVIRDITERIQETRAIQEQNIELEKANQAKDRFLASMSHELRTPLNAIIGFTGTLLMRLPGPLNDEQEDQLQTVERSATHLLSLINDLLDLAKIESGNVELNLVQIPCQSVIDEVIHTLQPMAEQKQLQLVSEMPERDVLVRTDRRALTQILLNLTTNALKFTERGTVRVNLTQHANCEQAITEIAVIDTGIGIGVEDQHKLFQAFQQVRRNDKVAQQGTGLGLQVSQQLAKLVGGEIHFASEPDKGSTFTLTIRE